MQKGNKQIKQAGLQLIAISYDKEDILKDFGAKQKIKFPLLSDPKSKVIEQFGLINKAAKEGSPKYRISHPKSVIVDQSGTVLSALSATVTKRNDVKQLLAEWGRVKEKASKKPFADSSAAEDNPVDDESKPE